MLAHIKNKLRETPLKMVGHVESGLIDATLRKSDKLEV